MKNYRVWEANRKVFLYPENYIRPELRDTKTPEFETLESTLLQGEINKANVDATFSAYLDRFADIGNLKMAGANVYNDGDERVLLLFGHSRTGALQYYYRTARFPNNDEANTAIWAPWQKVELMIAASRVFPVQFMGRLMLFWIEINEIEDSQGKITQQDGNSYADVTGSNQKLKYYASVKYSFKNFSEQWCTPQTLKDRIELEYKIDAAFTDGDDIVIFSGDYCLKTSDAKPYGDVKRIAEAYPDIPREFHTGISAATIYKNKKYFFKGNKCYVEDMRTANKSRIVSISNLIKYEKNQNLIILNAGPFGWANFSTIAFDASISASEFDAAFTINDTLCLVDNSGSYYFYKEKSSKTGTHLVPVQTIDSVTQGFFNFTIFANKQNSFDPADAVFQKGNQYFVIRGGQYEVYSVVGKELQPIDGHPKPIKGNLGINMDKLFDKLHVELEQQTNKLHITYTTPNDSVLLYGTLNTDFSFDTDRNQYNNVFQRLRQAHSLLAQNNGSLPDTSGDATLGSDLHTAWEDAGIHNQTAIELRNAPVATNLFESVVQNASALTDSNKAANRKAFSNSVSAYREFVQNANNRLPSSIEPLLSYVDQLETLISAPGKRKDDDSGDTKVLNKKKLETLEKTINDAKKELNRIVIVLQQSFNKLMDDVQALLTRIERLQENLTDTGIYTLTTSLKLHHSIAVNLQNLKNQIVNLDLASSQTSESGLFTSVDTLVSNIFKTEQSLNTSMTESLTRLSAASRTTDLEGIADHLTSSASELDKVLGHFSSMTSLRTSADQPHSDLINSLVVNIYNQKEILAGRNDIFPSQFQIENRTNFSFSEPNWYVFEEQMGSFLCRPLAPGKSSNYEIIRLNTSNTPTFTQNLFAGGIDALLSRETQALDEWPKFGASHIRFNRTYFGDNIPQSDHLDFKGANAEYYWELFFHAPFLIAATLNENQKFEEAKQWYEYIFDPTDANQFWKFLPFNGMDDASQVAQIEKYLNDPFDPHAIAALRLSAYKKTIIMAYVDNLLDWGDMLFQQYTHESINEARMLYILAYDLLGERPQNLGQRLLSDDRTYVELLAENSSDNKAIANNRLRNTALSKLTQGDSDYDFLVYPPQTPNASVLDPYFYVPPNTQLTELWTRVEDRLYKIRHCLNLKGISQPLPLFQPPIDPMALVQAVSSGAGLDAGLAGLSAAIPHYRFSFSVRKAQELVSKLGQFGGELLSTLEKRDAEELSQMQNQQEQTILSLTRNIRKAQLEESKHHLASLKESKNAAEQQLDHYSQLLASGLSAGEIVQIALMTAGSTLMTVAAIGKLAAAIPESTGEAHVGPFIAGVTTGGKTVADVLGTVSESSETGGDALSTMAEIAGILAQHHRSTQDWELQKK
ncbi:MAG: neuraminidase-like domain-containing protein, partial [Gammaproteobacteria bacterium]|nr:neuraminidase-like domain-containing protein [Gammaproteobacteria bacterium]